jgi:hypothetical protein
MTSTSTPAEVGRVRLTIDVDEAWISHYVAFDEDGTVTLDTSVLEIVGIERL